MTTGTELCLDVCERTAVCSRYTLQKKETSPKERVETTAAVQGVMVETWEYDDEDYVFVFGHEVSADVQRHEKHSCIGGASR